MYRTIIALIAISGTFTSTNAAVVDFIVKPSLTRWSMRGAYYGEGQQEGDLAAQFPGSQITSLTGILRVDLTPTTIQFLPGSALSAVVQPLPQQPAVNGAPGAAPANYGMTATLPAPIPVFAVRDFGFTLSSPPLGLVGNEFEPFGLQFAQDLEAIVNAHIDYDLGTANGSLQLADWRRGFDDDSVGSITTSGVVQRLTLQNYLGDILALQSPSDLFFEWAGPIVATRVIPEPNGLLLAVGALGVGAFFAMVRRRGVRRMSNAWNLGA